MICFAPHVVGLLTAALLVAAETQTRMETRLAMAALGQAGPEVQRRLRPVVFFRSSAEISVAPPFCIKSLQEGSASPWPPKVLRRSDSATVDAALNGCDSTQQGYWDFRGHGNSLLNPDSTWDQISFVQAHV